MVNNKRNFWVLGSLLFILAVGCRAPAGEPTAVPEPQVTLSVEPLVEAPRATEEAPETGEPTATAASGDAESPRPEPTQSAPAPTPTPQPATATPEPPATEEPQTPRYMVVGVAQDDVLNVRSGPGVAYDIVGRLDPNATSIEITGEGRTVGSSLWVPVVKAEVAGWVNSTFLAQMSPDDAFCDAAAVQDLLSQLRTAIADQDGAALAQHVHPAEGLSVRLSWWNPEIHFTPGEVATLFTSTAAYAWGVEDGSGFAINGSFADKVLPLLERDLLPAEERACNQILRGSTAGIIQLPPEYEGSNFYAFHRPAPEDGIEFDWGTWVVGIEAWQGAYYVRYLVHYQYEI